jgi:hypothetical protein
VSSVVGLPTGYVLQAVDGEPVTSPVLDSHTKLEEMKVELALLSDPATFPCNLKPSLDGKAMLVKGFVPNDMVRERAIQVVRTGTHLTVGDGMKIHASLAMRSAGVPVATLQQGALDLLTEAFPEVARDIEITAKITGQLTLTGNAHSYEEKLAVSQRLRRLNGCTAVVNQLKVVPVMKDGESLTMVTADGLHVVPADVAEAMPETGMLQATPAVRVIPPSKGTATMDPLAVQPEAPSVPPSSPSPMESAPMPKTLPPSLPPVPAESKPAAGSAVTEGTVSFDDEPAPKPQEKK